MRIVASAAALLALSVAALAAPPVPRKSPEFTITDPSGKQILLSSYKGKVVVIAFMYTTCPHCQREAQMLTKVYQDLGPKGFQPLGAAFNDATGPMVSQFIKEFNVGFPVGYAKRESVQSYLGISVMDRYVVPQVVVINKRGEIVAQSNAQEGSPELQNEATLRPMIEKLLKEPTTSGASSTSKTTAAVTKKN